MKKIKNKNNEKIVMDKLAILSYNVWFSKFNIERRY